MIAGSAFVCSLLLAAAPQAQQAQQTPAGMPPPWEAKETILQLREKITGLSGALGKLAVLTWEGTGASNYVAVADSTRKQVAAIGGALDRLALDPQRLTSAIYLFLSLQQLTGPLESLTRGVAQFQGAEAARDIEEATNALLNERERFVKYVLDMVRFLESTASISQRELDSCREQLFKRASEPIRAPARRR